MGDGIGRNFRCRDWEEDEFCGGDGGVSRVFMSASREWVEMVWVEEIFGRTARSVRQRL